jgi:hypothetical protein
VNYDFNEGELSGATKVRDMRVTDLFQQFMLLESVNSFSFLWRNSFYLFRSPVFPISDGDNLDSQVPSPTTEAWQPGRFEAPASPIYEPGDPDNEVLSFILSTPPRKQMDVIVGSYKGETSSNV